MCDELHDGDAGGLDRGAVLVKVICSILLGDFVISQATQKWVHGGGHVHVSNY